MRTMTAADVERLQGLEVVDAKGDKLGKLEDVYLDIDTGLPEWLGIGTGFLHNKRRVVPAATAELAGDEVRVPYEKGMVKDSPDVDGEEIPPDQERELFAYYGVEPPQAADTEGGPDLVVVRVRRYVWS
jgi:sporulation protein YlmC with PRC-barrel domain